MRPSRGTPALFFLLALVVFGWCYAEYLDGHSAPVAAFILPPLGLLAVGGLVDPRILWSIGPRRAEVPTGLRVVGAILFAVGLVGSLVLMMWPRVLKP